MGFSLDTVFMPRTALPKNVCVREFAPSEALRPYVRCFWTMERDNSDIRTRIIPDFCADIIFDIKNNSAGFVGVCTDSFVTDGIGTLFGIRFYAWSISRFVRNSIKEAFDFGVAPEDIFIDFADFKENILHVESVARRIELSENYLINLLDDRCDPDVMNGLYSVIMRNGDMHVSDLAKRLAVSRRTLERKFLQCLGMSPKTIVDLIRYQLLWQDCIKNNFSVFDGIDKFGYFDQAHMYNDFKKYHGIGLSEARREYRKLSHFYNTSV